MVQDLEFLTRRELLIRVGIGSMALVASPLVTLATETQINSLEDIPKYYIEVHDWKPVDITDKIIGVLNAKGIGPNNIYSPENIFKEGAFYEGSQNRQWCMRSSIIDTTVIPDEFSIATLLGINSKRGPYLFDLNNKKIYDLWSEEDILTGLSSFHVSFSRWGVADNGSCIYSIYSIQDTKKKQQGTDKAIFADLENSRKVVIKVKMPWTIGSTGAAISGKGDKIILELYNDEKKGNTSYIGIMAAVVNCCFSNILDAATLHHLYFDEGYIIGKSYDASRIVIYKNLYTGLFERDPGYRMINIDTGKSMDLGPIRGVHGAVLSDNGDFSALTIHDLLNRDEVEVFAFVDKKGFRIKDPSFVCGLNLIGPIRKIDNDGTLHLQPITSTNKDWMLHITSEEYKYKNGMYYLNVESGSQSRSVNIEGIKY